MNGVPFPLLIAAGAALVIAGLSMVSKPTAPTTGTKVAPQFELIKSLAAKWGKLFSVPLPMILTICHIESSFNPSPGTNMSNALVQKMGGAWGVAQMTVQTATGKVAQIKASPSLAANSMVQATLSKWTGQGQALNDPDLCLLIAVYMLSGLWVKYKGDPRLVGAAYHSGSGTVDKAVNTGVDVDTVLGPAGKQYTARVSQLYPTYSAYA